MNKKIWFITGISGGLGKALAQAVIDNGEFVIGTFRTHEQTEEFNAIHKDKAFAVTLDITSSEQIATAINTINSKFSKIDVLVNNAGLGFAGAIEETSTTEVRAIFEANFFGTLELTQKVLPILRQQQSGHIIQISSHGGFKAFPGFGIYNASKFALEGFSEALAIEVAPLVIKTTIVEPGPFRTNFAGSSFQHAANTIDDYNATAGAFKERMKQVHGHQEGDPVKAAQAIYSIAQLDTPPLRLPLGKIAVISLTTKMESVQNDLNKFREIAESVVF
jgi:NAD(P)-dependent dehydrogenase (short-subunit alcohol dehydrogenase family)